MRRSSGSLLLDNPAAERSVDGSGRSLSKHPSPRHPRCMTTIIRAEQAHDFLALVPMLAGFRPERSIVCVAFRGNRTVGVLRHDLPRRARDRAPLVSVIVGTICRMPGIDAVVPVVYTDARFAGRGIPERALLQLLVKEAERAGFTVRDALCRGADAWASVPSGQSVPAAWRAHTSASRKYP